MEFTLADAGAEVIDELYELLVELHRHESEVSPALGAAPARPDDEYVQLYASRFGEWFAAGNGILVLAREVSGSQPGGTPIGFAFAVEKQGDTAYDTGERIGYVEEIAVLERARHRGVGRALMAAVLDRFRARGLTSYKLSTVPGNDAARGFYTSLGMTPAATLLIGHVAGVSDPETPA